VPQELQLIDFLIDPLFSQWERGSSQLVVSKDFYELV
jgi:hypothetical protein